ncbi:MAG: host attachment protein [Alphaproteobacteria bacterium]|nr:host attachment protein [Alphaproteobacteria bacterium]
MANKMRIDKGEWLVVCDGRKALILENIGDEMYPNLRTFEVHEQPNPPTSAHGSDAPGRYHATAGGARSALEQTDWHDEAERAFLRTLAGRLDTAVVAGETPALILVASPRALGMIRSEYSATLRRALRAEIGKDLVKLPVYEIEKQILASGAPKEAQA